MTALLLCCMALLAPCARAEDTRIEPAYPVSEAVGWLLETATAELGYTETRGGVTKYGQWSGDPDAEWCAEYLCWCVNQVDETRGTEMLYNVYPKYGGTNVGIRWFIKNGRFVSRKGTVADWGAQWYRDSGEVIARDGYIPQPGDWCFFSYLDSGDTTHVAMVEYCTRNDSGAVTVHMLEGNNPSSVARAQYALDDWRILGYGTTRDIVDTAMRGGCEGVKVLALQEKLERVGLLAHSAVTGTYGSATANAVRALQEKLGIEQTGAAGYETLTRVDGYVREYLYLDASAWMVETP